jgi:indolepyruvate decarboxylase
MGMGFTRMPAGATFYNQTLWGSIGWATPAAFGAAVAAPDRRVVLITGEGAHQLTAQEISQFPRYGLKPIVFVLNNNGYLIERLLCKDPAIEYNDVSQWHYADLPKALGCDDWYCARVTTCAELDAALDQASHVTTGAYIEVVTDPYAASPLALQLHDSFRSSTKPDSQIRHPELVESRPPGAGEIESPKAIPPDEGERERTESTISSANRVQRTSASNVFR